MSTTLKTGSFEGPLDLLLQLIDAQKLPITDISLSAVTEQYFAYLNSLDERKSEALADFLVVGTKLVYLKSRELLPDLTPEGEGIPLAEQLRLYQRFVAASKMVVSLWNEPRLAYGREHPVRRAESFALPNNATTLNLQAAMHALIKRLKPIAPIPEAHIDRTISLRERIAHIFDFLQQWKKTTFSHLVSGAKSKTEVIVGFLAVLELLKQDKVAITQPHAFSDMEIHHV
jgi:segregation and condensation protein A